MYFSVHLNSKQHEITEHACAKFLDKNTSKDLNALDLGCGTGRDTLFLLEKGFKVTALDAENEAIKIIKKKIKHRENNVNVTLIVSKIQSMKLPEQYNLISSNLTLPFIAREDFHNVWSNIVQHIKFDGRFSGQFFGVQHEWANPQESFFTYYEIKNLFQLMFHIEYIQEFISSERTVEDGNKLWHQWDIIARKKAINPEKPLLIQHNKNKIFDKNQLKFTYFGKNLLKKNEHNLTSTNDTNPPVDKQLQL